jgi:hypothetical protein
MFLNGFYKKKILPFEIQDRPQQNFIFVISFVYNILWRSTQVSFHYIEHMMPHLYNIQVNLFQSSYSSCNHVSNRSEGTYSILQH